MIDFSGVSAPFGAGELLSSAVELLGVVGPFILLGMSILFAPKLINLVRSATINRLNNEGRDSGFAYENYRARLFSQHNLEERRSMKRSGGW